jgi:signal transduction histidine kinase/ActR/RegA family two-component response regulator
MKIWGSLPALWRNLGITYKFGFAVVLLLAVVVLVALVGFLSLGALRQAEDVILTSEEIRHLVYEMDGGLEKARRLHRDFFLQYQSIGFDRAHKLYFQPSIEAIARVVAESENLKGLIAGSGVSQALQQRNVDINLYLSSARRFSATFLEMVDLVTALAAPETGLEDRLNRHLEDLAKICEASEPVYLLFLKMDSFEEHYRVTRQRPFMQSSMNQAFLLGKALAKAPEINEAKRTQAENLLKEYTELSEKILETDSAIQGKFNDFALQSKAVDPISEDLKALATAEVQEARTHINQVSRLAAAVIAAAALVGLLCSLAVATLINGSVTRKIVALTQAAGELRAGNLEAKAPDQSGDEFGELAEAFNSMASRMKDLIGNLEDKVRLRTNELALAKDGLEKAVEDMKRAKNEALAAAQAKSEFLANMSHEIRTPLTGIMGMLQILRENSPDGLPGQYLDMALRSSQRLASLLSDILDISRMEADKVAYREEIFQLDDLFAAVSETFQPICRKKGLELTISRDPAIPRYLAGDHIKVRQVLFNFVGNAVKFTQKGGLRMEAWALAEPCPGTCRVYLAVSDTGVGIAEEKIPLIFESFVQADCSSTKAHQGAGLGLSIVKNLARIMDASLAVDSEPGQGTTVVMSLVFRVPDAWEIPKDQAATKESAPAKTDGLRILLAEDEPIIRLVLLNWLGKRGHRVTAVDNGRQALLALSREDFDCLLMDVQMPDLDGLSATKIIRGSEQAYCQVPIVALTAHAMQGDREKFLAAGMDHYLSKPVDTAKLEAVLEMIRAKGLTRT